MSATDDIFGANPSRPTHPDFWRISEILLDYDGPMQEAKSNDEKEVIFHERTEKIVDSESVGYMAIQRTQFAFGNPFAGSKLTVGQHATVAALILEAFLYGAEFEKRGGHQDPGAKEA